MSTAHLDDRQIVGLDPRLFGPYFLVCVVYITYSIWHQELTPVESLVSVTAGALQLVALWIATRTRGAMLSHTHAGVVGTLAIAGVALSSLNWGEVAPYGSHNWTYVLFMVCQAVLCLRGRPWGAVWMQVVTMAFLFLRAELTGGDLLEAVVFLLTNLPFFLIALYISAYVRPTVRDIFRIREATLASVRAESAAVASVAARNERLDWIDETAGPLLQRIATGDPLSRDEREECRLLEAGIRDDLRAPGLTGTELDGEVVAARRRGVDVVLLDDSYPARIEPDTLARLRTRVAAEIAAVDAGKVTVRIVPHGRRELATLLLMTPDGMRRSTIDTDDLDLTDDDDRAEFTTAR